MSKCNSPNFQYICVYKEVPTQEIRRSGAEELFGWIFMAFF